MRADLCPPDAVFMTQRNCHADRKSILSFALDLINRYKGDPTMLMHDLNRSIVGRGSFSTKMQIAHPRVNDFIRFACGHLRFSRRAGSFKYDEHGVYRLNDMLTISDSSKFLSPKELHELFGMSNREDAYAANNSTSDVELLMKLHERPGSSKKTSKYFHRVWDYTDSYMSGMTSVTIANILLGMSQRCPTFSHIVYVNKYDVVEIDPWNGSKDNHLIICVCDHNGTSHWFCMGKFLISNKHEYFLYCSCNTVAYIFEPFIPTLLGQLAKDSTVRTPVVQSQFDGNYCGMWPLNLAHAMCTNDVGLFRKYFIKKVTEPNMLKDARAFISM